MWAKLAIGTRKGRKEGFKLSDAISQFNNDNRIKTFSEVAAQAAKNVENTAKNNINNVENVAKQSIDVVNSRSVIENIVENARDNGSNISSSNTLIKVPTSELQRFFSVLRLFSHLRIILILK